MNKDPASRHDDHRLSGVECPVTYAKVYVPFLNDKDEAAVKASHQSAAGFGFIRSARVMRLRRPELTSRHSGGRMRMCPSWSPAW